MKIRKILISAVAVVVIAAAVCSGCARMTSDYVPNKVFHYDDSQDPRELLVVARDDMESEADPYSHASVIISDDAAVMHRLSAAGSVTLNDQTADETSDETWGEQAADMGEYGGTETEQRENAPTVVQDPEAQVKNVQEQDDVMSDTDEYGEVVDDHSDNVQTPNTDTGEMVLEYPDENGDQTAIGNENNTENEAESLIAQPEDPDPEPKDDSGNGNEPDDPGEGGEEEQEQVLPDPNKVVELSWEGELGTYIWGEDVDLSDLIVTAHYEDGHSEVTEDYYINMNYPERQVPSLPNTYDNLGTKHMLDTYEPGTYYAEIGKDGVTADVPYELIIEYVTLFVNHRMECLNPAEHSTEPDEYGHLICHDKECLLPDANGDRCLLGEGETLRLPLYYDYVFTEDDAYEDIYLTQYFDLGNYLFMDFPGVADKYTAGTAYSAFNEGCYSTSAYVRLVVYDYREFRGDSPCRFGSDKTEEGS